MVHSHVHAHTHALPALFLGSVVLFHHTWGLPVGLAEGNFLWNLPSSLVS